MEKKEVKKEEPKKKKVAPERIQTSLEALRKMPVAMQVGPQLHLRKGWSQNQPEKLKGGK